MQETFDYVRKISAEMGCFSCTSRQYQDDILQYLLANSDKGMGVIEIGCYKGGLTALLASVCKQFNWPLYSIDIDEKSVLSTINLLEALRLSENVEVINGTLQSFANEKKLSSRPSLIILDGDHQYDAVIRDIEAIYNLDYIPYAAVFHDYSLRHATTGERVDDAIRHCFGQHPVRNIGMLMDGTSEYPTKEKPAEDGHWWNEPGSEGALMELPMSLKSVADSPEPAVSRPFFKLFSFRRGR